jgi:hypothetical protein
VYLVVSTRLHPGREERVVRPSAVVVPNVSVAERLGTSEPPDDVTATAETAPATTEDSTPESAGQDAASVTDVTPASETPAGDGPSPEPPPADTPSGEAPVTESGAEPDTPEAAKATEDATAGVPEPRTAGRLAFWRRRPSRSPNATPGTTSGEDLQPAPSRPDS